MCECRPRENQLKIHVEAASSRPDRICASALARTLVCDCWRARSIRDMDGHAGDGATHGHAAPSRVERDDPDTAGIYYREAVEFERQNRMEEAIAAYREAASLGSMDACYALGVAHANGEGVPVDQKLAVKWYERASSEDHVEATHALGYRYWFGRYATPCDPVRAMDYFALTARAKCRPLRGSAPFAFWCEMTNLFALGLWLGLDRATWTSGASPDANRVMRIVESIPADVEPSATAHYVRAGLLMHDESTDLEFVADALRAASPPRAAGKTGTVTSDKADAALCVLTGMLYTGKDTDIEACYDRFSRSNVQSVVAAFIACDVPAFARIPAPVVQLIVGYLPASRRFIEADEYFAIARREGIVPDMYVALLRRAAELGSGYAQKDLGVMIHNGHGSVVRDPLSALRWHMAAADQGIEIAAVNAANVCLSRVPSDVVGACAWFAKGVKLGNQEAMYRLGHILIDGGGGYPRDAARGVALIRAAANKASPMARCALANALEVGEGVPAPDLQDAAFWYDSAYRSPGTKSSGVEIAIYNAGELLFLYGLGATADEHVPLERRAEAAVALWRRGADMDEKHCCYRLGWAHATGTLGCRVDAVEALLWFERARANGHHGATRHLAARWDTPGAPCLFSGYHYGVDAECSDAPVLGPLLGRSRSEAAVRLGVDLLNGREFAWSAIEATRPS